MPNNNTTIQVSKEFKGFLDNMSIKKETYEQTLRRLIEEKWGVKIPEAVD